MYTRADITLCMSRFRKYSRYALDTHNALRSDFDAELHLSHINVVSINIYVSNFKCVFHLLKYV